MNYDATFATVLVMFVWYFFFLRTRCVEIKHNILSLKHRFSTNGRGPVPGPGINYTGPRGA